MTRPSANALLVALVLAPDTYSRNKYFELFQEEALWHARRRAQILRSIIRDLTEPWPHPGARAPVAGPDFYEERPLGEVIALEYRVSDLDYRRSAVLTPLEAATLHYALAKSGHGKVSASDQTQVETALRSLGGTDVDAPFFTAD